MFLFAWMRTPTLLRHITFPRQSLVIPFPELSSTGQLVQISLLLTFLTWTPSSK